MPVAYLEWANREVKNNPNAHEDLVRLANWGVQDLEGRSQAGARPKTSDVGRDPEAIAVVPPPPPTGYASSSDGSRAKPSPQKANRKHRLAKVKG